MNGSRFSVKIISVTDPKRCPKLRALRDWTPPSIPLLYNRKVRTWDAIIVGGGIIGLSLARRLKIQGVRVLVIDKQEPAHEASYAAGGMIASCDPHIPPELHPLVAASAAQYPEFVHALQDESGESVDLRDTGTIAYFEGGEGSDCAGARKLAVDELSRLEPLLQLQGNTWLLPERCVDPRGLGRALVLAAKHRGVDFVTGSPVVEVLEANGRACGVKTARSEYASEIVVNCSGAWAAQILPLPIPTRPVKGQMVCLVPQAEIPQADVPHARPLIQHVVRAPEVYVIPRSDGRILLGATVEEAGFDKRVDPGTIQTLYQSGIDAIPALASMRIHDAWAGLRPGTPDNLPILGETSLPGYYAATGHYRDGILLAPITAQLMAALITGCEPVLDLQPFSPLRFG
jgi:glycine oxidase